MEPERAIVVSEGIHRLRREDYDRLVEDGAFEGRQVELLYGVIVPMSPQGPRHSATVRNLNRLLTPVLLDRADVLVQSPFATLDSEPEPDIAVVPRAEGDDEHPDRAFLLIEVAVTSHVRDRDWKAAIYAAAAVPEYWMVDLVARSVLVHRDPHDGRYSTCRTHDEDDTVVIAAFPDVSIPVSAILPRIV